MDFLNSIRILMLVFLLLYFVVEIINIFIKRTRHKLEIFLKFMIIFNKFRDMRLNFEDWIYSCFAKNLKQNKILKDCLLLEFNRLFWGSSQFKRGKFFIYRMINSQRYKNIVNFSKILTTLLRIIILISVMIEISVLGEIKHPFVFLLVFMLTHVPVILIQSLKEYFKLEFFGEVYNVFDYVSIRGLIQTIPSQYLENFLFCPIEYKIKLKLNYVILQMDPNFRWVHNQKKVGKDHSHLKSRQLRKAAATPCRVSSFFEKENIKRLQNYYKYCYCGYQICKFVDMETSDFLYRYFIYPIKFLEIFIIIRILSTMMP